ncbi:hypothetical protein NKH18_37865 [Streptomyces sp. M10(2022)]
MTARPRPPTGSLGRQRDSLGGDAARHLGRTRDRQEGRSLPTSSREGGTLLGDILREGLFAEQGTTQRRSRRSPSAPESPRAPSSGTSPTGASCWWPDRRR